MPDGDQFFWKVRGPGSRKLVEVALGGADPEHAADFAVDMVVPHLNDPDLRLLLQQTFSILNSVSTSECPTVERLQQSLRMIAGKGDVGGILAGAASSVLASELGGRRSKSLGAKLLTQFAGNLVECRSLTHARAEILAANSRTYGEHCEWIASMRAALDSEVKLMAETVFEGVGRIRRPSRLIKRRPMTRERLDEPIG